MNLKPCPFCESVAEFVPADSVDGAMIGCSNRKCPAFLLLLVEPGDTVERNVELWNNRTEKKLKAAEKICRDAAERLGKAASEEWASHDVEAANIRQAQSSLASQLADGIRALIRDG